jgi:hypothetical protein
MSTAKLGSESKTFVLPEDSVRQQCEMSAEWFLAWAGASDSRTGDPKSGISVRFERRIKDA